mmetsp:Transcript_4605/g.15271  ORF Transcript_4605/g.15271 Transcript_4605/m.15271 type:complete len:341 (+) Transcript_4605:1095-2117(+)
MVATPRFSKPDVVPTAGVEVPAEGLPLAQGVELPRGLDLLHVGLHGVLLLVLRDHHHQVLGLGRPHVGDDVGPKVAPVLHVPRRQGHALGPQERAGVARVPQALTDVRDVVPRRAHAPHHPALVWPRHGGHPVALGGEHEELGPRGLGDLVQDLLRLRLVPLRVARHVEAELDHGLQLGPGGGLREACETLELACGGRLVGHDLPAHEEHAAGPRGRGGGDRGAEVLVGPGGHVQDGHWPREGALGLALLCRHVLHEPPGPADGDAGRVALPEDFAQLSDRDGPELVVGGVVEVLVEHGDAEAAVRIRRQIGVAQLQAHGEFGAFERPEDGRRGPGRGGM